MTDERPWHRESEGTFRVPRHWKCGLCLEWLVAKTTGYDVTEGTPETPLQQMVAPVIMRCCLKHKRPPRGKKSAEPSGANLTVLCLPCFQRLRANRADENGDHCPLCKLKISSWTRRAEKDGTLVARDILQDMETFVAECGLARQPPPFQFALVEDVVDECLKEAGDIGVQRNVVDAASSGGGGLGLLAERDKMRLAEMGPEAAAVFREQLAEREAREQRDLAMARDLQKQWNNPQSLKRTPQEDGSEECAEKELEGARRERERASESKIQDELKSSCRLEVDGDGEAGKGGDGGYASLKTKAKPLGSAKAKARVQTTAGGRKRKQAEDILSSPSAAAEPAAAKKRRATKPLPPTKPGHIRVKDITNELLNSLPDLSHSASTSTTKLRNIMRALTKHFNRTLRGKKKKQRKYVATLAENGVVDALRRVAEKHPDASSRGEARSALEALGMVQARTLGKGGDGGSSSSKGGGGSSSKGGGGSSRKGGGSSSSKGGGGSSGSSGSSRSAKAKSGNGSSRSAGCASSSSAAAGASSAKRKSTFGSGSARKKVPANSDGVVSLLSSDDDDGLLDDEAADDKRNKSAAMMAAVAAETPCSVKHPNYTAEAQALALMFSPPCGDRGEADAAQISRAAIWGALHMHGGNTNEAAATLFDWHSQSPALLKELERQGAKAIVNAGR